MRCQKMHLTDLNNIISSKYNLISKLILFEDVVILL